MTTSTELLRNTLLADGGVAAMVGTRVWVDLAPERPTYPFVIVRRVANTPLRGLNGSLHARLEQFHAESWGASREQSQDLHDAVEAALVTADLAPAEADPDGLDPEVGARACVWVVDMWT